MRATKFYGRVNLGGVYGRWTSSSVDLHVGQAAAKKATAAAVTKVNNSTCPLCAQPNTGRGVAVRLVHVAGEQLGRYVDICS